MTEFPCSTCKYCIERKEGHRVFLQCKDEKKHKGYNDKLGEFKIYSCSNYKKEVKND